MNEILFWTLIDVSRQDAEGDPMVQTDYLCERLASLTSGQIFEFDLIMQNLHEQANAADLRHAAHLIWHGCSNVAFTAFCNWLISRGRTVFEAALSDPDTLAGLIDEDEDFHVHGLHQVAPAAWERRHGSESAIEMADRSGMVSPRPVSESRHPTTPWSRTELEIRFPKLADKFA